MSKKNLFSVVVMATALISAIGSSPALAETASGTVTNETAQSNEMHEDSVLFGLPGESAREVKTIPDNNGLAFTLENTDELRLDGDTVQVFDEAGEKLLDVTPELPEGMTLWLDKEHNEVFAIQAGTSFRGCTSNKWVKWGLQAAWDGLVCVPGTAAATPLTPIGQAGVAAACHGAGSGLVTAVSC